MRDAADDVLEARARALSRPREAGTENEGIEVVTFTRHRAAWAIGSNHVLAVSALGSVAALPGIPPPVRGVVAWKGQVLVVIDVSRAAGEAGTARFLLVLGDTRPCFGLLADSLGGLRRLAQSDVSKAPDGVTEQEALLGVTRDAVLVLDGTELIRTHT